MTKKNTLIFTSVFAVLFAAIFLARINSQTPGNAPDVSMALLDGTQTSLSAQLGRPVLLSFWASTCHLCLQEIPELIALYEEMKFTGLVIIGVAMPYDPPYRVLEMSRHMGITYPVAFDIDGRITDAFGGVSVTPTAFLVSAEGAIVSRFTGRIDMQALRSQILESAVPAGDRGITQDIAANLPAPLLH